MRMWVCGWISLAARWEAPEPDKQRNEKLQRGLRVVLLAMREGMEGTLLPVEMLCRRIRRRPHFHHSMYPINEDHKLTCSLTNENPSSSAHIRYAAMSDRYAVEWSCNMELGAPCFENRVSITVRN